MAGEGTGGGEPKAPFTEEQLDAIGRLVNKTVNGATLSLKKQFETSQESLKGDLGKLLDEKLSNFKPADKEPDDKAGKNGKGKGDDNVELQTLRRELAELRTKAENSDKIASAERTKNRNMSLRSEATEQLAKIGITGTGAKLALNALLMEGRIGYSTDIGEGNQEVDELLFKSDEEGWVSAPTGFKTWAKTPDAKIFIPATGAAGSGGRPPPRTGGTPAEKQDPEQVRNNLGQALDRLLE